MDSTVFLLNTSSIVLFPCFGPSVSYLIVFSFMAICQTPLWTFLFLPSSKKTVVSVISTHIGPSHLLIAYSKLYEALLGDKIMSDLSTSCNQFRYKPKLGTEMCIFAFKEVIDCYNKLDKNIYWCLLDASRDYDRISHKILFKLLHERDVLLIFIRILAYWCKHQTLYW